MNDEARKILEMIQSGKITAGQGAELLDALRESRRAAKPAAEPRPSEGPHRAPGGGPRQPQTPRPEETRQRPSFIGIYVTEDGKEQVRVKIPLGLADCFEKFVPKVVMAKMKAGDKEIDLREILRDIRNAVKGDLVNVDGLDGTKVRVCCE